VVPVKIAGNLLLSSEAIDDGDFNVLDSVGEAVSDAMGPMVDTGVLYGDGLLPSPLGIRAGIKNVAGATLRVAAITAAAEIMSAGGKPSHLFLTAPAWATEVSRKGTGGPFYPEGHERTIAGLKVVFVPSLQIGDALVADTSRCYAIVWSDFKIEVSREGPEAWNRDGSEMRIIGRVAAAIPVPSKSIRALTVGTDVARFSSISPDTGSTAGGTIGDDHRHRARRRNWRHHRWRRDDRHGAQPVQGPRRDRGGTQPERCRDRARARRQRDHAQRVHLRLIAQDVTTPGAAPGENSDPERPPRSAPRRQGWVRRRHPSAGREPQPPVRSTRRCPLETRRRGAARQ